MTDNNYTDAIGALLSGSNAESILYGIGLPSCKYTGAAVSNQELVDFIVGVEDNKAVRFLYNPRSVSISG